MRTGASILLVLRVRALTPHKVIGAWKSPTQPTAKGRFCTFSSAISSWENGAIYVAGRTLGTMLTWSNPSFLLHVVVAVLQSVIGGKLGISRRNKQYYYYTVIMIQPSCRICSKQSSRVSFKHLEGYIACIHPFETTTWKELFEITLTILSSNHRQRSCFNHRQGFGLWNIIYIWRHLLETPWPISLKRPEIKEKQRRLRLSKMTSTCFGPLRGSPKTEFSPCKGHVP